jgi:hypothetical protein
MKIYSLFLNVYFQKYLLNLEIRLKIKSFKKLFYLLSLLFLKLNKVFK